MMKPPRKIDEPVLTRHLLGRVLLNASIIILGTSFVFFRESPGESPEDFPVGNAQGISGRLTTITFTTFVMFDMWNALACRSVTQSVFSLGFFTNKVFLYAVSGSLFGQLLVIYTPPLQSVFQTQAL
eukprot:Pgem_evm1s11564